LSTLAIVSALTLKVNWDNDAEFVPVIVLGLDERIQNSRLVRWD
jgi:hypothetical protein